MRTKISLAVLLLAGLTYGASNSVPTFGTLGTVSNGAIVTTSDAVINPMYAVADPNKTGGGWITTLGTPDKPLDVKPRSVVVSNITYVVQYKLRDPAWCSVPALEGGKPHWPCTAYISSGTNDIAQFRIAQIDTEWTKDGCWEDSPLLLVGRALRWTRYPNNSAGPNVHWHCDKSYSAMWAHGDAEPEKP